MCFFDGSVVLSSLSKPTLLQIAALASAGSLRCLNREEKSLKIAVEWECYPTWLIGKSWEVRYSLSWSHRLHTRLLYWTMLGFHAPWWCRSQPLTGGLEGWVLKRVPAQYFLLLYVSVVRVGELQDYLSSLFYPFKGLYNWWVRGEGVGWYKVYVCFQAAGFGIEFSLASHFYLGKHNLGKSFGGRRRLGVGSLRARDFGLGFWCSLGDFRSHRLCKH